MRDRIPFPLEAPFEEPFPLTAGGILGLGILRGNVKKGRCFGKGFLSRERHN